MEGMSGRWRPAAQQLQALDQHADGQTGQDQGKHALERLDRQGVGGTGTYRSHQHAAGSDADQGRKPDIADRVGWQRRGIPATDDVADHVEDGDRESQRRTGGHGIVDRHVVPGHEGDTEETATGAEQAGKKADDAAGCHLAGRAGHLPCGLGLAVEEHLAAGKDDQHAEDDGQPGPLEQGKHADADNQGAEHDARGDALDQIPADLAMLVVGTHRGNGREDDGGHGSGNGHLDGQLAVYATAGQDPGDEGDQHHAASDAQQSRHEATQQAQHGELGNRYRFQNHGWNCKAWGEGCASWGDKGLQHAMTVILNGGVQVGKGSKAVGSSDAR